MVSLLGVNDNIPPMRCQALSSDNRIPVPKPFVPKSLGKRIAHARRLLGVFEGKDVTVPDMAGRVGVTPATAYAWEADEKSPREPALDRLAAILGVSPAYLRYGVPIQPGPTEPSPTEKAEFVNGELAAARAERERVAAAKAAGGSKGRTRRR